MEGKRVKLTRVQLQILSKIQAEKEYLQQEFAKVTQRETEVLTSITESHGLLVLPGSQLGIENDELIVPELGEKSEEGSSSPNRKRKKTKIDAG